MCTVLLPPGVNPIAVNKDITSYHIKVDRGVEASMKINWKD
jgi:hypothetical protein